MFKLFLSTSLNEKPFMFHWLSGFVWINIDAFWVSSVVSTSKAISLKLNFVPLFD